ncbi:LamG domain-containing protein [Hoeflea sp. WL0058]|uniref:LamG domain-containing protein n=1 Tax=Flavimaribacter sediminis TaxID=2865987 RepID=A0AAE2ZLH8_9HYPH|nr:LamG domain-containing protein [Flavimaribacter sediminis]MBW8639049.1 LamG domain-containing protein [Flavimaribacter sediminis]
MLPYIVGYLDKISATPGETLKVHVSCTTAEQYEASLVRTICGDLNPKGPGFKEEQVSAVGDGTYPAREQVCNAGSCVLVLPQAAYRDIRSFTLQAHIWPTTPELGDQAVISLQDAHGGGVRLGVGKDGCMELVATDRQGQQLRLSSGVKLTERQWYFVALVFDADAGALCLYQEPYARTGAGEAPVAKKLETKEALDLPSEPMLVFAARMTGMEGERCFTDLHFNGKIEKTRFARGALSRLQMEVLRRETIAPEVAGTVLGFWDFSREISGERIIDLSKHAAHGKTVNLPTRAMTGANWTGEEVNWNAAPEQYGAIHFHDDDLHDAQWDVDFELILPENLKSGVYAVRLVAGDRSERIPIFVRPVQGSKRAPVAFLASTATYLAYANLNPVPFDIAELLSSRLIILHEANRLIDEHKEWGPSLYDIHSDGSGVAYSSRLRPILNFRPGYISSFGTHGSNLREYNADTHIFDWLEAQGVDYDVITDEDLHAEGYPLLSHYQTIVTGSHPEYFSPTMWEATKSYVDGGGRLMVLGGNGFYWRIAYHPALDGVMEVRRCGPAIRTWETQPGEEFHSFDGKRGGLWRAHGRPPQSIVGCGFISEGFDLSTHYRRTQASKNPRAAFIFDGIDEDVIGDFGLQGGGAAGVEIDHADPSLGTPTHALIVASSEHHTESYRLVNEEMSITVPTVTAPVEARIAADMVFFETSGGGAVFNVGSIAWAGSLSHNGYDNNVSRITANVLDRFTNPEPFVLE